MENETEISIIIPAAGMGRRMKSYGPKSLIDINGKTVLQNQLEILQKVYPKSQIIVVTGFAFDKVNRFINNWQNKNGVASSVIETIHNKDYEVTNVAESIKLGIAMADHHKILTVMGDLVFNENCFNFSTENNALIYGGLKTREVGLNIIDKQVMQLAYGLPVKWSQIMFLCDKDIDIFYEIADDKRRRKYFAFEIINFMINHDVTFSAYSPEGMEVTELDTPKDINEYVNSIRK